MDPSDPFGREAAYWPAGVVYQYPGVIAAIDGFLKDDNSVGVAFISMGGRIPNRCVQVGVSTRPEMTAITLALEQCLPDEELTILTDS